MLLWDIWLLILLVSILFHFIYEFIYSSISNEILLKNLLPRTIVIKESVRELCESQRQYFYSTTQNHSSDGEQNQNNNNNKEDHLISNTKANNDNNKDNSISTTSFPIMALPMELLPEIFSYLDLTSVIRCEQTCKLFNLIIYQNTNFIYENALLR